MFHVIRYINVRYLLTYWSASSRLRTQVCLEMELFCLCLTIRVMCKTAVYWSPLAMQHPVFYRPNAPPVAQSTVSKHCGEKHHIPRICSPHAHFGVFEPCIWNGVIVYGTYMYHSKPTFSTNLFHHNLLAPTWTAFSDWLYWTGLTLLNGFHF